MQSLATPPFQTSAVASDATVRPVRSRRAGASPATDLAARAPEAAVPTTSEAQRSDIGELRTPPRTTAQPIGTRASAGEGDTPANTNGLCLHGIRRAHLPLFRRLGASIGSSTAGHGVMPAVERPPRSSRTSAPLQAYKRGRCSTTVLGTSARGAFALDIVVGSTAASVRVRHGGFSAASAPTRRSPAVDRGFNSRLPAFWGATTMTTETESDADEAGVAQFEEYEEKLDELRDGLLEAYCAGFSHAVDTFDVDADFSTDVDSLKQNGAITEKHYYYWDGKTLPLEFWLEDQFKQSEQVHVILGEGGEPLRVFEDRERAEELVERRRSGPATIRVTLEAADFIPGGDDA